MITKDNLKDLLRFLQFSEDKNVFSKHFEGDFDLKIDFNLSKIIYPTSLKVHGDYTTNFSSDDNFVVFECVYRLLAKGYKPHHIE
jgi:type I restriction enzyme M protein